VLTLSRNTAVRKEDFEMLPVLLQFFDDSAFEVETQIIQKFCTRRNGILLEELFILDANFLQYLFVLFLFAGGLESSIS
jgi:hypothetical protein